MRSDDHEIPSPRRGWGAPVTRAWSILLILILTAAICAAQSTSPVIEVPNPPNTAEQQAKHYVVLVSLDGFRYDYATKYGAKNLLAMAARGASAPDGMIPSFPSVTFPNHYTIVTGLYPDHHGIVGNTFYDPARKETYTLTDPKTTGDGSWYGGTPLWVLAEQQGMRAACFYWPTSDAEIQGKRPSYYLAAYDDKFPDEKRVEQVLAWLQLPPEKRPHFITLYFENTDDSRPRLRPDAPETAEAVRHVDEMIGKLSEGIAASGLPVDLIVVSDHGMETLQGGWVILDKWADLSQFETVRRPALSQVGSGCGEGLPIAAWARVTRSRCTGAPRCLLICILIRIRAMAIRSSCRRARIPSWLTIPMRRAATGCRPGAGTDTIRGRCPA